MSDASRPSFGIATAPMQVAYHDILRVWREADAIGEIEHAWLFDHLHADRRRSRAGRSSRAGRCCRPWPRRPSGCASACW